MTRNSIILKGTTYLLLGVMLYMHVCSAWCGIASRECCVNGENNGCNKSVCSDEKKSDEKGSGCQDFHLSFFKTSGQFASEKNVEVINVFPPLAAEIPTASKAIANETGRNPVAFNNYHPPPPIADIRIFIRSFQI